MADRVPSVETTDGYDEFLQAASQAVLKEWEERGGSLPEDALDRRPLRQRIIRSLEGIFTERR